jgi:hypothetical protein
MTRCVDTATAAFQILFILDPVIRAGYRGVWHTEHPALHFHRIPEEHVRAMYPNGRPGFALNLASGEYVIKVCVGVDDADYFQAHRIDRQQDALRVTTWIKNITDTGFGITYDGAITL